MYCVQNQRTVKLDELVSMLITNLNTSKKNEHIEQVARLRFIITLFKFKECTRHANLFLSNIFFFNKFQVEHIPDKCYYEH